MTRPPVPPAIAVGSGQPADVPPPPMPAGQPVLIGVLVVDDDARVRIAIGQTIALEADMSLIGEAADAASAMALAAASHPVVALVDVLLPDEGTGLSLIRTLCERPRCAVVAMSVDNGIRDAALAAGAATFIEKADDIDALLHSIRAAARSTA
jgi:DNA-binding NarL/FixJ family response regulator